LILSEAYILTLATCQLMRCITPYQTRLNIRSVSRNQGFKMEELKFWLSVIIIIDA